MCFLFILFSFGLCCFLFCRNFWFHFLFFCVLCSRFCLVSNLIFRASTFSIILPFNSRSTLARRGVEGVLFWDRFYEQFDGVADSKLVLGIATELPNTLVFQYLGLSLGCVFLSVVFRRFRVSPSAPPHLTLPFFPYVLFCFYCLYAFSLLPLLFSCFFTFGLGRLSVR